MKILFIRFSSIGDIVLTTPLVRCVKQQMPHAQVHYLSKKNFADILDNNPYIDKRFYLDGGDMLPIVTELLKEKYDIVIDLHRNLRTWYVKSLLKQAFNSQVRAYTFSKLNIRKL